MKIQLLPSTFDQRGCPAPEQRLTCFLIDDRVAIDAGSLGLALTKEQRETVRDVLVTHTHIDHIASLPIFVDDLFATLKEPIRVHATEEVIELLERDIFNSAVYPRFSEMKNENGPVMEYVPFRAGEEFQVAHLRVVAVAVNHVVPTVGLLISSDNVNLAFSSDTASTEEFWHLVNRTPRLNALLVETSFPGTMAKLAEASGHLTPITLLEELRKMAEHHRPDILIMHLKPAYREVLVKEIGELGIPRLSVIEPGREYEW